MSQGLRYRDESELPESIRKRLQKRFGESQQLLERTQRVTADYLVDKLAKEAPNRPRKPRRDLEHTEQVVFFNRIRAMGANEPRRYKLAVERTFAIPNGGGRSKAEAGRLKAEGVMKGVSDIFLSLPAGENHGLYIEMKAPGGKPTVEQMKWIVSSSMLGYVAGVCYGADEAVKVWRAYVKRSRHSN